MDQNEKLVHYGVTYVLARDGYSGKIVGWAVMSRKNNAIIYNDVYRMCSMEYGLWDQLRVDHGREFYLTLYIQEKLRACHGDPNILPYIQTTSTQNHIIERVWVEVNQRVTYPIKRVISMMDDNRMINMDDSMHKFCVSYVLQKCCSVGLERMIHSWNNHSIPRKGIPNSLALNSHTNPIQLSEIPTAVAAVSEYRQQGGSITDPSEFGEDPLRNDDALARQREQLWLSRCDTTIADIYTDLMVGDSQPLQDSIIKFIEITQELDV